MVIGRICSDRHHLERSTIFSIGVDLQELSFDVENYTSKVFGCSPTEVLEVIFHTEAVRTHSGGSYCCSNVARS